MILLFYFLGGVRIPSKLDWVGGGGSPAFHKIVRNPGNNYTKSYP
jgi:hypothetical protein